MEIPGLYSKGIGRCDCLRQCEMLGSTLVDGTEACFGIGVSDTCRFIFVLYMGRCWHFGQA